MGGVAGHLSHLHENLDFTFGEIKSILQNVASANLEVVEKVVFNLLVITYCSREKLQNLQNMRSALTLGQLLASAASPEDLQALNQ